ncbi:hypothetical protein ABZ920_11745 [Streptomyces sp. NPDC046831]|uniref:hypothetical protein n=1 Tax=Streptomyces sp. NPDC046831 TaxID=3154805 RepID=UPI0033D21DA7
MTRTRSTTMSHHTPSQAEGDRDDADTSEEQSVEDITPSQAEGDRDDETETTGDATDRS